MPGLDGRRVARARILVPWAPPRPRQSPAFPWPVSQLTTRIIPSFPGNNKLPSEARTAPALRCWPVRSWQWCGRSTHPTGNASPMLSLGLAGLPVLYTKVGSRCCDPTFPLHLYHAPPTGRLFTITARPCGRGGTAHSIGPLGCPCVSWKWPDRHSCPCSSTAQCASVIRCRRSGDRSERQYTGESAALS
jgi:hypothetical protein